MKFRAFSGRFQGIFKEFQCIFRVFSRCFQDVFPYALSGYALGALPFLGTLLGSLCRSAPP